ncbi:Piwi domain-containing protein [Apodospora peruviana]|uniref:Piwi domain-containing protein n=1 Tax=Apodospora peruviana TaxID=516989 RepID=A0AAE0IAI1_9PEZI|nr:Piwi domain-containing protein [Apodospora peruviana]
MSNPDVKQFDITVSPEPTHPIVYEKVWKSRTAQVALAQHKNPWIYDYRKIAWSTNNVTELKIMVDLDQEKGRLANPNSTRPANKFLLIVRCTGKVRLEALKGYLTKKSAWDTSVLECISFLDHVLRQGPSERMKLIKRTLFNNASETHHLNAYTEAIKGIYSAVRLNESINQGGLGLGVNVDVSNQTFWIGQKFEQLVRNFLSASDRKYQGIQYGDLYKVLKPVKTGPNTWGQSEAFRMLRRLHNVRFEVSHRGKTQDTKEYKVKRFTFAPTDEGANAKTITFEKRMPDGKTKTYSIFQYYAEQYNARLQYPSWPMIETNRAGYFPMEVCEVQRFNPFPFKLDPDQTSEMIKFAVQRPPARREQIMKMVQNLDWDKDKYLRSFGVKIDPQMQMVAAKLIKSPIISFKKKTVDPRTTGRWDLRGQEFVLANREKLNSWAFCVLDNSVDRPTLDNFIKVFVQSYKSHGGSVASQPLVLMAPAKAGHNEIVEHVYNQCGNNFKQTPQIIFFVLKDKTSWVYERLKKNADCRWAIPTQMVQASNVRKAQGQYCSNVCMKVNAKLGGQTTKVPSQLKTPTMFIGVDVSHGAPGSAQPSMAAMCVSMDKDCAVYRAAVQTNGWRTEVLTPSNTHSMLPDIIKAWRMQNRTDPEHVFYLRDGVSEGQFAHVMEYEVEEFKRAFKATIHKVPKITVIICTKRHHIRFFPEKGDKNGNAFPGTLVEREVTHPFHYDFYLCSHSAIQGTARPVHYNVIHDEIKMPVTNLQQMLYHHCYQYCRSTTPVSLHPAVYYAHLASNRARAHENLASSAQAPETARSEVGAKPGLMAKHDPSASSSTRMKDTTCLPLLPIGGPTARPEAIATFKKTMWWV